MPRRFNAVGDLTAHRPLLTASLIALGLCALAVISFLQSQDAISHGFLVADYALHGLFSLAAPVALAALAPVLLPQRILFAALVAGGLYGIVWAATRFSPFDVSAVLPTLASMAVGAGIVFWFISLRPLLGGVAGPTTIAPIAGVLGAMGAASLMSLETHGGASGSDAREVIGAVATLSLALGCLVGVCVAAEFSNMFARGMRADQAAASAAHFGAAPAVFAVLATLAVFSAGFAPGAENLGWLWRTVFAAGGGVALAVFSSLVATACTLCLSAPTEMLAVNENRRRQTFRDLWRPVRLLLPPSSAIAVVALLLILTVVALFETYTPFSPVKLALIAGCAAAAGLAFVSMRTAVFVLTALLISLALADWGCQMLAIEAPSALGSLAAIAAAAVLYGFVGLAWRDARSPRRKPHEATETAMICGAYRYLAGAGLALGSFILAGTSGLWPEAVAASVYLAMLIVLGGLLAAPLMTCLSAISERG